MSDDADQITWLIERKAELQETCKLLQEECARRGQRIADLEKIIIRAAEFVQCMSLLFGGQPQI